MTDDNEPTTPPMGPVCDRCKEPVQPGAAGRAFHQFCQPAPGPVLSVAPAASDAARVPQYRPLSFLEALRSGLPIRRRLWVNHPPQSGRTAEQTAILTRYWWAYPRVQMPGPDGTGRVPQVWINLATGTELALTRFDYEADDWEVMPGAVDAKLQELVAAVASYVIGPDLAGAVAPSPQLSKLLAVAAALGLPVPF